MTPPAKPTPRTDPLHEALLYKFRFCPPERLGQMAADHMEQMTTLARQLEAELAEALDQRNQSIRECAQADDRATLAESSLAAVRADFERECQDGDKIAEALGVKRTEGGSLNVGKMLHAIITLRTELEAARACIRDADELATHIGLVPLGQWQARWAPTIALSHSGDEFGRGRG